MSSIRASAHPPPPPPDEGVVLMSLASVPAPPPELPAAPLLLLLGPPELDPLAPPPLELLPPPLPELPLDPLLELLLAPEELPELLLLAAPELLPPPSWAASPRCPESDGPESATPESAPPPSGGIVNEHDVPPMQTAPREWHLQSVSAVHEPGFPVLAATQRRPGELHIIVPHAVPPAVQSVSAMHVDCARAGGVQARTAAATAASSARGYLTLGDFIMSSYGVTRATLAGGRPR